MNGGAFHGREFIGITDFGAFQQQEKDGDLVLLSPELDCAIAADEIVLSWNASAQPGAGLKAEVRAECAGSWTGYYNLGIWSPDCDARPRQSVTGQSDGSGEVHTDILALRQPAKKVQARLTLHRAPAGDLPLLKLLAACLADSAFGFQPEAAAPIAWGCEMQVPERSQLGWPGGHGWCSPTCVSMVLAFWAEKLCRPELEVTVQGAAKGIFDPVWDGTGNWPFNMAFAGAFAGMRAYVTRFASPSEIEEWIAAGIPVIVSLSYNLLKGLDNPNDAGHLMVLTGFTSDGDPIFNDPHYPSPLGPQCRRTFPRAALRTAWRHSLETVYLIHPEGWPIPANAHGHWLDPHATCRSVGESSSSRLAG